MNGLEDFAAGFVSAFALLMLLSGYAFYRVKRDPAIMMRALTGRRKRNAAG